MDRRRPLLSNGGERLVDAALRKALSSYGAKLDRKARLASVLAIDGSELSDEDFSYALKAELDFVVSSGPDRMPQFAVEFDGARHMTDPKTIRRDRRKEHVCQRLGLPLLRIGVEALSRRRKRTVLAWLIDVFYLAESFYEGQEAGVIPADEPFMYFSVFEPRPGGGLGQSIALDQEARLAMFEAHAAGLAPTHVPEEVTTDIFQSEPRPEVVESFALFEVKDAGFILGHSSIRNFGHFGGVAAPELASDLAVADAGKYLRFYRMGRYRPMDLAALKRIRARTQGWRRCGAPCSDLPFEPLSAAHN